MSEKDHKTYLKKRIEGHQEVLRNCESGFSCACCGKTKQKGEAAGVKLYEPDSLLLKQQMMTPQGPRVATYVLCLECSDSYPDSVIQSKVTKFLAEQGLFDDSN